MRHPFHVVVVLLTVVLLPLAGCATVGRTTSQSNNNLVALGAANPFEDGAVSQTALDAMSDRNRLAAYSLNSSNQGQPDYELNFTAFHESTGSIRTAEIARLSELLPGLEQEIDSAAQLVSISGADARTPALRNLAHKLHLWVELRRYQEALQATQPEELMTRQWRPAEIIDRAGLEAPSPPVSGELFEQALPLTPQAFQRLYPADDSESSGN